MEQEVLKRSNLTFRQAAGFVTLGMILPAVPMSVAATRITNVLNYGTFLGALALSFGLITVMLIERLAWDRPTVLVVVIVWPWVVFFGSLLTVLVLNEGTQTPRGPVADVFRTLLGSRYVWNGNSPSNFIYGIAFMLAGIGAVLFSMLLDRVFGDSGGPIR